MTSTSHLSPQVVTESMALTPTPSDRLSASARPGSSNTTESDMAASVSMPDRKPSSRAARLTHSGQICKRYCRGWCSCRARATASSLECTPSARRTWRTWFLTVSGLRCSSSAICFVERPWSSMRSTSRLTRGQLRMGRHLGGLVLEQLPEDADHPAALDERYRTDLDRVPVAGGVDQDGFRFGRKLRAGDLAEERLARAARVLGRHHRGELAAAHVTDEPPGGRVHPADDAGGVDRVARHVDVVQRALDVAAEPTQSAHGGSVQTAARPVNPDRRSVSPRSAPAGRAAAAPSSPRR